MAAQNLRARYSLVSPPELMGIIQRSESVALADSPNDRIVGFECDGKLWGFEVGNQDARRQLDGAPRFREDRTTCPTCGHTDVQFTRLTPEPNALALLKSHDGRKKLEKTPCDKNAPFSQGENQ